MGRFLGRAVFDSTELPSSKAFDAFRSRGWPGFASAFTVSGDASGFFYRSRVFTMERTQLYSFQVSGLDYRRESSELRDGSDHILLQSTQTGGARWGEAAGVAYQTGPGSVGVVDLARPVVQSTASTHAHCILFQRDLFPTAEIPSLTGFQWRAGGEALFSDYLRSLLTSLADAADPHTAKTERSVVAVLRACKLGPADALSEARPELENVAVDRARRMIRERLDDPTLDPGSLARAVGVSRATLYRTLQPHGGVMRLVQVVRLAAARTMILDPQEGRSIAELAACCGFGDNAHFSRAFRAEYGVSPSDLRPVIRRSGTVNRTCTGR